MIFRTRLAIGFVTAAIIPLALFGFVVRREMTARLDAQATRRVEALVGVLRADLAAETSTLRTRLRTLAAGVAAENRFRLATGAGGITERRWLLDWAGEAMAGSGLAVLRVMDSAGRVLSSGHFRNEFDRLDSPLPAAIALANGQPMLIRLPAPDGDVMALAAMDSFTVAGRHYRLVGGLPFDAARAASLVPQDEIAVALVPGEAAAPNVAAEIALPLWDAIAGSGSTARLVVTRDPAPMKELRTRVDRWLAIAAGLTLLLAGVLAVGMAARVSRPLADLAEKTSRLDLDRLDQDFASDRRDEIGALGNLLSEMTGRLRTSTSRLREAERRAATGDLARQINHDVKNGLAPIRHVLRHLSETAARHPEQLAAVFADRRETLESSVTYLEGLARNYARLAPALDRGSSDLGALLQEVARGSRADGVEFEVRLGENLPPVRADAVVLRRIVENLVSNAVDALEGRPGRVTLSSEAVPNGSEPRVRLTVADTGRGMTAEELDRAFDDFHTTKTSGTGLGLSVVRRLVGDLGGTLRVDTSPGQGSTFMVEILAL
ncbi:MAG TPA: HAMP domain-containing sensor histidine kinase [Gemmatimonadales bacterium]